MRLDGTIRHGLDFNVGNAGSWTTSVAFGPLVVSGGGGVQSDWNESDTTSMAYIKNKPTNVSAFNNDAGYLNNNFCPIIEDTRSSAVAATITGNAPFASLENGQRIILHLAYNNTASSPKINLTLSNGQTTGEIDAKAAYQGSIYTIGQANIKAGYYVEFVYDQTNSRWLTLGYDNNTVYTSMQQSSINTGTDTVVKTISPKLFHDNAYIVEEAYTSGSLKANKFYNFGTVSSALTIPDFSASSGSLTGLVSNALNFYALRFIAGADNLNITFPQGVIVDDEPTINTGDYVEIMINLYVENNTNHFYASIKIWQAQQ